MSHREYLGTSQYSSLAMLTPPIPIARSYSSLMSPSYCQSNRTNRTLLFYCLLAFIIESLPNSSDRSLVIRHWSSPIFLSIILPVILITIISSRINTIASHHYMWVSFLSLLFVSFNILSGHRRQRSLGIHIDVKSRPLNLHDNGHHHVIIAFSFLRTICDGAIPRMHKYYYIDD